MGKFKNPLKVRQPSGFEKMKSLPQDQYGRYRDRINNQQMGRKIRNTQGYDSSKIWGLVAFLATLLFGGIGAYIVTYMVRVGIAMIRGSTGNAVAWGLPWWLWTGLVLTSLLVGMIVYDKMKRKQGADRVLEEDGQLNDYDYDGHIRFQEEIVESFPVFPDRGAHSAVKPSGIISHAMLEAKGVPTVLMTKRYTEDVEIPNEDDPDEEPEIFYKGEPVLDEHGDPIMEKKPMIDTQMGGEVFDKMALFEGNPQRVFLDPRKLVFDTQDSARSDDQWLPCKKLTDLMAQDWEIPDYEQQRPTGIYFVDTAPVNVMLLAITRAGKGLIAPFVA